MFRVPSRDIVAGIGAHRLGQVQHGGAVIATAVMPNPSQQNTVNSAATVASQLQAAINRQHGGSRRTKIFTRNKWKVRRSRHLNRQLRKLFSQKSQ